MKFEKCFSKKEETASIGYAFPDLPDHYTKLVEYMDGCWNVCVAESGNFVTVFKWDGMSASWNEDTTFMKIVNKKA